MVKNKDREEDKARAQVVTALVATALGMPAKQMSSGSRARAESSARAIVYYVLHCAFDLSFGRVAAATGRDRSTVAVACRRMEDRRDDPYFDRWLDALERAAAASPLPIRETERAA